MDPDENSLVKGLEGDWEESWPVIASDLLGDPVMAGPGTNPIRILSAAHGECYSSSLWKGKRFETAIHIAFTVLWGYITGLFILISKG